MALDESQSEQVVLTIGSTSSTCGACRRNADPDETAHVMETMKGEGCGAVYTHVTTGYINAAHRVKEWRSDLIFLGLLPDTPPKLEQ